MSKLAVLFDVGATTTRFGLFQDGSLQKIHHFPTDPASSGPQLLLQQLAEVLAGQPVAAICGDIAGLFDAAGTLLRAGNLPHWVGAPIGRLLRERYACAVYLQNDVVLCGLGEAYNGAGSTAGVMVYVTVSTGVNAVRIVDGAVDPTLEWFDLGRQVVADVNGQPRTLEDMIGGWAVAQRFGKPPQLIRDSVFWHETAGYLARGICNIRLCWDPDVIVLGGSMMRDIPLPAVGAGLRRLNGVFSRRGELRRARLGDDAGLYGAAIYLQKNL